MAACLLRCGVLLLLVAAGAALTGCMREEPPRVTPVAGKRVVVTVTTDSGRELVVQHNLRLERGMTALDALRAVADVRMGPGGVVMQVNGYGGGRLRQWGPEQAGWFYRVNGIEADKDPARFRLRPGQSLWWDLRRFDIYERVPVAIGVFPEPLFNGYRDNIRPLRIVYGSKFRDDALHFERSVFQNIRPQVRSIEDDGLFGSGGSVRASARRAPNVAVRSDSSTMVIARWEEARLDPYIADIALDPRAHGITVWVEGTDIRRQLPHEEFSRELDDAEGFIWASTLDGEPDSPVVLLVSGITDEGVRAAARALRSGKFQYFLHGAVDREGNVIL